MSIFRQKLSNECVVLAKIGVDTAEKETLIIWRLPPEREGETLQKTLILSAIPLCSLYQFAKRVNAQVRRERMHMSLSH